MNMRRIKALRNFIATLPEDAIKMQTWLTPDAPGETVAQAAKNTCGTQACIAGWAVLRFYPNRHAKLVTASGIDNDKFFYVERINYAHTAQELATKLLGLTSIEADQLFGGVWRTNRFKNIAEMTRRDVIKELDHILRTGVI